MASAQRLNGAIRLARTIVDSDHAPFMERELAWAVLALARAKEAREEGRMRADPPTAGAESSANPG